MSQSIAVLTGLAQNIALLLSLTLLYSVVRPYWSRLSPHLQPFVTGTLFGLISIAGMHTPILVVPGVIADARIIPVLLAGPFGGPGAAAFAAVMASLYRLSLGGVGTDAGVGTILTAGVLGVIVGVRWHGRERHLRIGTLVLLGLALDLIVLAWSIALPDAALARRVLHAAALPVGLFIPFGTVILGALLVNESRRHAERERLILTQSSLDRAAEALFWTDASGRIVNVNPAAVRLTGYRREDLLAMRVWELDLELSVDTWHWFWSTVRTAGSVSSETRYRRCNGSEFPVERSNDFVEYRGHEWISMFVRDVTDRKQAEHERTRHLARERALRAQAEEANVLKDQFLATLSHELRTPLTSILGYARLLRTGTLKASSATHALEVIERNTRAQAQIVDDLLDVSSIVMRKLRIERRPTDLVRIVASEVEGIRLEAEGRGLLVVFHAEVGVPPVLGDAGRLQQVVRNLLSNALKFTESDGEIDVRVFAAEDTAYLTVRDTGRGIEPSFLPHVFDRFRQADNSMTRAHEGLGVGLAIAHHLLALHDGQIQAHSDGPGKGATFTVMLPLLGVRAGEPTPPRTDAAAQIALPDLGGVRVLVVEDKAVTRELITTVLVECGAAVTPAASADQALAEMGRAQPEVLVCDLAMPDVDGLELIRRVRRLPPERGGKTPAAALTGFARRADAERALEAGFEAHVVKPFEPVHLARVVAQLAGRSAA